MKTLASLVIFLAAQGAFAAAAPIATKHSSSGTSAPQYRTSEQIEVFANGDVKITKNVKGKQSESKKSLKAAAVADIKACVSKLHKDKAVQRPDCAGGSTTSYYAGEKLFQIKACGTTKKIGESCATSLASALDKL